MLIRTSALLGFLILTATGLDPAGPLGARPAREPAGSAQPARVRVVAPAAAWGDLDGDGALDVVELGGEPGTIRVRRGDGAAGWSASTELPALAGLDHPRLADVDADGRLDLVATRLREADLVVHLGDGAGGFAAPVLSPLGAGAPGLEFELADLDGDGRSDVAMTAGSHGRLHVHLGQGDGRFGPALFFDGVTDLRRLRPADVDRDGRVDLVALQRRWPLSSRVWVLFGRGDGGFERVLPVHGIDGWADDLLVIDVDGNGLDDVVLGSLEVRDDQGRLDVLLATAPGVFAPASRVPTELRPRRLVGGDLDGDGRSDVAIGDDAGRIALLRGRGDGGFDPWCRLNGLTRPSAIADMDLDGRADLVLGSLVLLDLGP